jgi:hypothetical protein
MCITLGCYTEFHRESWSHTEHFPYRIEALSHFYIDKPPRLSATPP